MADDTRVYRHHEVREEGGTGAVAIVAIVIVVLVAIVLTVVYWDNIFGTAPVQTIRENTIITDTRTVPAVDNDVMVINPPAESDTSTVVVESRSGETAPLPQEDTTA